MDLIPARIVRVYFAPNSSTEHAVNGQLMAEIEIGVPNCTVSGDVRRVKRYVQLSEETVHLQPGDAVQRGVSL